LSESIQVYKSYNKLGGKEYEEEYTSRIVKEIKIQFQHFEQLNNGNMRLRDIQKRMQEELKKAEKERQENERKFLEIKEENSVEKAMLLSIIDEEKKNIESMKEGYEVEMKNLMDEMTDIKGKLIEARSQGEGEIFIFCLRIFNFNPIIVFIGGESCTIL
jgi:hypothetical protein